MKSIIKKLMVIMAITALLFVATGCEKEGSAEKAGKKIDQTLNSIKDKIDEAKE